MNTEEINNRIHAENDSYKRDLNRKQQDILKLKDQHQRTMVYLQNQKQQVTKQNTNENIFKSVNDDLEKFL